jgi:RHS repeat-associated protein
VSQVEFFANGASIGLDTTAPYGIEWLNPAAGSYSLTARATDNLGAQTTSSAVPITVNAPPTVSLISPAQNATFTAPANITLTADAADADGTVTSVEFYQGSTLLTTLSAAPYTFAWTNVPQGAYVLTAKATDDRGATTTSAPVNVTVSAAVGQLYFIHADHLNTPRLVADAAGTTVWRWDQQEPFGNNPADENPSGLGAFDLPLRLPGQRYDKETGLHYNYFRDYDPSIGRYVESDPIGLRGGLNTYAYVESNPLSRIDPKGLAPAPSVRCPPPPSGYQFETARVSISPVINCIYMTDPATGRHDLFCAEVLDQFTCSAVCVYRRVICGIPIPFMTIEKPGTCRMVDLRPS